VLRAVGRTKVWIVTESASNTAKSSDSSRSGDSIRRIFREGLKVCSLALAPLDGNGIATTAKDLGLGIGSAVGGYAYDKICSKAIDGSVFDV
jgi:hypothetical protein